MPKSSQACSNSSLNSLPPSTCIDLSLKRKLHYQPFQKVFCMATGGTRISFQNNDAGHRTSGFELFDTKACGHGHAHVVNLYQFAGFFWPSCRTVSV
ncbi:MAG: hypothetical protein QGD88_11285, partial [Anaerolineae bacterium]|nr:hypothetical protein [Anaerolineae bacterium]